MGEPLDWFMPHDAADSGVPEWLGARALRNYRSLWDWRYWSDLLEGSGLVVTYRREFFDESPYVRYMEVSDGQERATR